LWAEGNPWSRRKYVMTEKRVHADTIEEIYTNARKFKTFPITAHKS
jgi:hypothetical protein